MSQDLHLVSARAGDESAFAALVAPYRRELRAHCYRLSGSLEDADDLVQDTLLRAWRGLASFEGRSSLRTWLYRVATNACLDALDQKKSRSLPSDLVNADEPIWLQPWPGAAPAETSPEATITARESVSFAFLVALQRLPARQRAVLILRDVVGWEAADCASLLDTSVPAVNSALQRARDTLAARRHEPADDAPPPALLARYVDAWQTANVDVLVSLLHEDATLQMPPMPQFFHGSAAIGQAIGQMVLTPDRAGVYRLVPTEANGLPAFAGYARDPATGEFRAIALHVLRIVDGRIAAIDAFIDGALFPRLGLPATLAA